MTPHNHEHEHELPNYNRAFGFGVGLNTIYVVAEVIFGFSTHSLALLADAGHNLGDVVGLLLAWGANRLSRRAPTARHTYGLRRTSILAALLNAVTLAVAIGAIAWEAILRFGRPQSVAANTVALVASIGVVINSGSALLFLRGRKRDANIRAAFLHLAADAAVSVGVVIAAFAMRGTGWLWLDPAISLLIVVVVAASTWRLLLESIHMALDAVPAGLDAAEIETRLRAMAGVTAVHDLHVWPMSTTETALTVHLVKPDAKVDDEFLECVRKELHDRFGIDHATIQIESTVPNHSCELAPNVIPPLPPTGK